MRIDPWSSEQYEDYASLRSQFEIEEFTPEIVHFLKELNSKEPEKYPPVQILFRRGVIFGHRSFDKIQYAIVNGRPWAVLTGLMPSGRMHIGNKMVIDQVIYYQNLGAEIFVAVADIESFATRNMPLEKAKELALNEFIVNYIALGLKPEKCQVYFQSKRKEVKDLTWKLGKKVNWSQMKTTYGFNVSTNMGHAQAPLIQVGDILHVQLKEWGGPKATIVPVGVDQDPHMMLTRDIARKHRRYSVIETSDERFGVFIQREKDEYGWEKYLGEAKKILEGLGYSNLDVNKKYGAIYLQNERYSIKKQIQISDTLNQNEFELGGYGFHNPSSTYNKFMTGLTGGKMSSSIPESCIFLTDNPEVASKKIMKAKTGGAVSLEEQKKDGGVPQICTVFELFTYHLIEDDNELKNIYESCRNGSRMCGECKKHAAQLISDFLVELKEKRELARERIDEYVVDD